MTISNNSLSTSSSSHERTFDSNNVNVNKPLSLMAEMFKPFEDTKHKVPVLYHAEQHTGSGWDKEPGFLSLTFVVDTNESMYSAFYRHVSNTLGEIDFGEEDLYKPWDLTMLGFASEKLPVDWYSISCYQ